MAAAEGPPSSAVCAGILCPSGDAASERTLQPSQTRAFKDPSLNAFSTERSLSGHCRFSGKIQTSVLLLWMVLPAFHGPWIWPLASLLFVFLTRICKLSHIQLFSTPGTVARGLLCPWDSLDKDDGLGCHFLLQGIFSTQGSNTCLLRLLCWQVDSLQLPPPGNPPP